MWWIFTCMLNINLKHFLIIKILKIFIVILKKIYTNHMLGIKIQDYDMR